jgi:hypothetical protein
MTFKAILPNKDKIGTDAATYYLLIRDSLVGKPEMAGRLVEEQVDDRIFHDNLTHTLSCRGERADAQAIRPDLFTAICFVTAIFWISKDIIQNCEQISLAQLDDSVSHKCERPTSRDRR